MKSLPQQLIAMYVEVSAGIYGYVVKIPAGYDVLETKITRPNEAGDPIDRRVVVGIRLKEKV